MELQIISHEDSPFTLNVDWTMRAAGLSAGMPSFQLSCNPFYDLHRVVCDYIAGMTDRFALDEHAKMFDPNVSV